MHRISQQDRARNVRPWVWGALIAAAVIVAVVWAARPDPAACRAAPPVNGPQPETVSVPNSPVAEGDRGTQRVDPPVLSQARYSSFGPDVACSFPDLPSDGYYIAVPTAQYRGAAACGGYVDLYGPLGSVRAQIVDRCAGCAARQYNVSASAFARIADPATGVAQIGVSRVHNPSPAPDLVYRIADGSSADWLGLQFIDTGNPLRGVEIRPATGGPVRALARRMDDVWTISGAGAGPFTAVVTDADGHRMTVPAITVAAGRMQHTGRSLYGDPDPVPAVDISRTVHAAVSPAVAVCS